MQEYAAGLHNIYHNEHGCNREWLEAMRLVTKLRALRKERGLSIRRLEEMTGVGRGEISRYERGIVVPKFKKAEALAEALGITSKRLLELVETMDQQAS